MEDYADLIKENPILSHFLPPDDQASDVIDLKINYIDFAWVVVDFTEPGPERQVALRKLLESMDSAIRALPVEDGAEPVKPPPPPKRRLTEDVVVTKPRARPGAVIGQNQYDQLFRAIEEPPAVEPRKYEAPGKACESESVNIAGHRLELLFNGFTNEVMQQLPGGKLRLAVRAMLRDARDCAVDTLEQPINPIKREQK